jgi:protein-L-isoaspartate(D-aspartate) O-methyltransferase
MNVKEAVEQVNQDYYMLQENGKMLTQTTRPQAIENGLLMLDVQKGQRVLEIGTGSGYSTALLATLVGDTGQVVSVDIEPSLTQRAQFKLSDFPWVKCVTGDGRDGYPFSAPYDRIIAWTTPDEFPVYWKIQLNESGLIVAPFQVFPVVQSTVMVRFRNTNGNLQGDLVGAGSYIPMSLEPVVEFFGPEIHADLVGKGDDPFWAGSLWMKKAKNEEWIGKFSQSQPKSSPFQENGEDIRAYLLAMQPVGYTFAHHPEQGYWIGYSSLDGFALASFRQSGKWIVSDDEHAGVLCSWWNDWEQLGKPSYEQLKAFIVDGQVKVELKGGE